MPSVNEPTYRYERKLTCPARYAAGIVTWIRCHEALFVEAYPQRFVNNIYLDSLSYECYRANLDGAADRAKARIRWYGELTGTAGRVEQPVLEFKIRRGLAGTKQSYPLAPMQLDIDGELTGPVHETLARSELPDALRIKLAGLRPALANRYCRRYFISADKRFRLTLDDALCYYPPSTLQWQRTGDDLIVLELKYDPAHDEAAGRILRGLGTRLSRNSKYVNGLQAIHP